MKLDWYELSPEAVLVVVVELATVLEHHSSLRVHIKNSSGDLSNRISLRYWFCVGASYIFLGIISKPGVHQDLGHRVVALGIVDSLAPLIIRDSYCSSLKIPSARKVSAETSPSGKQIFNHFSKL